MSIPHKTDLEKRWWHRLAKTLIWIVTILVTIISLLAFLASYSDSYEFDPFTLFILTAGPIAYALQNLIYKKIILYIVFGKSDGESRSRNLKTAFMSVVTIVKTNKPIVGATLAVLVIVAFMGYYLNERKELRDLRYRAYVANLQIGRTFNSDAYIELLTTDGYSFQSTANSITEAKVDILNMASSDLYELAEDCAVRTVCKEQLGDHIVTMSNAIDAGREYYEKLNKGADDVSFIRDKAMEMNRAVRMKYLIFPDSKFPNFTKEQLSRLIDLQWSVNFRDYIQAKKYCDEVTPYMSESTMFTNVCESDLFRSMFTFNFTDGEQLPQTDIQSVCDLEKNYTGSATCPITLGKVEIQRNVYANYLATHKNPYYSVSHFPEAAQTANSTPESFARSKIPMGYQLEGIYFENLDSDEELEALVFQVEDESLQPKEEGTDYFRTTPSQFFIIDETDDGFITTKQINTDLSQEFIAQYLHKQDESDAPYKIFNVGNTKWIVILSSQMSFDGAAIKPGIFTYKNNTIEKFNGNMNEAWGEAIHIEGNNIYLANGCIFDAPLRVTKITLQASPKVITDDLGEEQCEAYNQAGSEKWLVENLW